ncbi:YihY/virulence factor BrkB family protein [Bifidobacterium crudilactis]|jgi:membrane protein|uniref:YihY/virulence factor BrkB family protein n=1 Tax=Bifidobacterium crudilactis TaxID=327277 RepID=UPI002F354499|nr:YihY/virulence factor BrkB family protein [Bifidobacterium crudilactis]
MGSIREKIDRAVTWWKGSLLGRVLERYGNHNGSILAGGLAFGLLFAFFAGVWTLFSAFGLFFSNNTAFRDGLIEALGRIVPGLIGGSGDGIISQSTLNGISTTFTITGVITFVTFFWKIISWLGSLRNAVQTVVETDDDDANAVKSKGLDALAVLLVAILFVLTGVATGISGGAMRMILNLLGISTGFWGFSALVDLAGFAVTFVLNVFLFLVLLRMVSQIDARKPVIITSLVGAVALSVIQMLGARLITGASSNPLLAPFAAIIGVLLWFNLIAQVLMYAAALLGELLSSGNSAGNGTSDAKHDVPAATTSARHDDTAHGPSPESLAIASGKTGN